MMSEGRRDGDHAGASGGGDGFDGVIVSLEGDRYTTRLHAGDHVIVADEPRSVGGDDAGMTPYQLLLASLGACKAMTLRMYAKRKGWPLEGVVCTLRHERRHAEDCEHCEDEKSKIDHIDVELQVLGPLDGDQRLRLHEIADRCPVHRTLMREIRIGSTLIEE